MKSSTLVPAKTNPFVDDTAAKSIRPHRWSVLLCVVGMIAMSAHAADEDHNPPGPAGGAGTNWENPPGPAGGPGASPDRRRWRDRDNNPPGPAGGAGTNWENPPGPAGGPGASPDRRRWRDRSHNAVGPAGTHSPSLGRRDRRH